ncbi:esterase-like activity of phytase family protein [Lutimaribacter marinistellae]|uniref:esterase-like activity of phytase family protein n=1 Tax=Lutimaribacter marinistellae TaxID=1820329 RepID=UPI0036DB375B
METASARHLSSHTWSDRGEWFGGFSAIEVGPDGLTMTILTDRGYLATGRITRKGENIVRADLTSVDRLRTSKGKKLVGRVADSEGLAMSGNGPFYVSYEGVHRVAAHAAPWAKARVLPRPEAFRGLATNGSFEALAIDVSGRLYTMPESNRLPDGRIPVWRWDGRAWSMPISLEQTGGFLPVGADFGPDGRLYVLERDFAQIGFRSRLRRIDLSSGREDELFRTGLGRHDNLEGVSIWRDESGRLRATMISDDNFLSLQRTELVEYLLPD